jgi:hypothetical protein
LVKRSKKRRRQSKARPEPVATLGKWKLLFQKLSSPIGIVVSTFSFASIVVGGYLTVISRVSVEADSPLKSDSIISNPFRITNEGNLPIYNVKQDWLIEKFRGHVGGSEFSEIGEVNKEPDTEPYKIIPTIPSSESVTVYPFEHVQYTEVRPGHLKMFLIVHYETVFHLDGTKEFMFEGDEGSDGNYHWYHAPIR